jgi:ATP/maltotriose-dependent transcriptional regulator MalT
MTDPLLSTKLFMPRVRENRVLRPRLLEKFSEGLIRSWRKY